MRLPVPVDHRHRGHHPPDRDRSNYSTVVDRLIDALRQVEGAYSLVLLTNEALIGVRDPLGVRPLVLGQLDDAWILTSETCALDIIGARFVRDVEPGEIVIVDGNGLRSIKPFTQAEAPLLRLRAHLLRPARFSMVEGIGVYDARKRIGARARHAKARCAADVVVPVPDSGVPAAIGYAAAVGHAVRARHHPQPLCRPHLHRAGRPHPPSRRAPEAQRQPRP